MRFVHATLIGMIQYVITGVWKAKINFDLDEEEVLMCFEHLFRTELEREAKTKLGDNPYNMHGIPLVEVILNKKDCSYQICQDRENFLSCLICGLKDDIDGKKLCFNLKTKGVKDPYFKYLTHGNDDWIEMNSLFNNEYKFYSFPNQNVRRLISLFYERWFPLCKSWDNSDDIFIDYTDEEKRAMRYYKAEKDDGKEE